MFIELALKNANFTNGPKSIPNQYPRIVSIATVILLSTTSGWANRASRQEELSYYTFNVNREEPPPSGVHETLPEKYGATRAEPLNRVTVLVGYYRPDQHNWIIENGLYNIRLDKKGGLEKYGAAETGASYLLLHGSGGLISDELWKMSEPAPMLMSKDELIAKNYPHSPECEHYLVYKIRPVAAAEFAGGKWDIHKLRSTKGYGYTVPFAVSMLDFMKAKVT